MQFAYSGRRTTKRIVAGECGDERASSGIQSNWIGNRATGGEEAQENNKLHDTESSKRHEQLGVCAPLSRASPSIHSTPTQCRAMQCNPIQCNAIQFRSIQFNSMQCSPTQSNPIAVAGSIHRECRWPISFGPFASTSASTRDHSARSSKPRQSTSASLPSRDLKQPAPKSMPRFKLHAGPPPSSQLRLPLF